MCSCDWDGPEAFTETVRKARKHHECWECDVPIAPGDLYTVHSGVWDGRPDSFKICGHCQTLINLATAYVREASNYGEPFCWTYGNLRHCIQECLGLEAP